MPSRDFEAMCSAMVVAQTTEKLTLELEFETLDRQSRELWWKWLAYALFSRRARAYSSVKTLTLVGVYQLSAADVRAFNSILTAEHPEETLFGTPRGRVDERDATLKRGSPIRWEFDGEGQPVLGSHYLVLDEPIPFARTFSDDGESEWVHVLVPGFGHCQVQRTNLDFSCVSAPNASSSGITSLAISFYVDGMTGVEGLVPFIESVGSTLTRLVLDGPKSAHFQDMDENAIIRSCPNLQEVTLSRQLVEVQLDLSEYRAKNTPIPDLTFKWSDVTEFAEQLRDACEPLTKCVRRLRFSLLSRWVPEEVLMAGTAPNFEFYVNAIIKMLEENERLEYLEVRSPYYNYVKDFKKFHLKPIYRQRKPLAKKCMLALLSVLASRTPSTTEKAKKRRVDEPEAVPAEIDHHVVAKIFSFAAVPVIREVFFHAPQRPVRHVEQAPQAPQPQ